MDWRTELLGDLADEGYDVHEFTDCTVVLEYKGQSIAAFSQFGVTREDIQNAAKRHRARLADPPEILHCRNCAHWASTYRWQGNCGKHPWPRDKYSEDATANGCPHYEDKYAPLAISYERRPGEQED